MLFALVGLMLLSACTPEELPIINNGEIDTIANWVKSEVPLETEEDLTLPATDPVNGGKITWMSSDLNIMTDDGEITLQNGQTDLVLLFNIELDGLMKEYSLPIIVYAYTMNEIADEFEDQFGTLITYDLEIETKVFNIASVTWSSSNEYIFSKEGKYTKPENDELITISYTVDRNGKKQDYDFVLKIKGRSVIEKANEIKEWISTDQLPDRVINADFNLPTEYIKKDRNNEIAWTATIDWYSSNADIITPDGKIRQYGFDRYVNLQGVITIDDKISDINYDLIVPAKTILNKEDKIIDFLDAVAVSSLDRFTFSGYTNITQTFNFLSFYETENYMKDKVVKMIVPDDRRLPGDSHEGIQFITIHDTANTDADALAHALIQYKGEYAAEKDVSWHFQTDDEGVIQSIPITEYAWHAGDGKNRFQLIDTGVKATKTYPSITINQEGKFVLNGETSVITAPKIAPIADSGIYTEIGANGNYHMNATHFSESYGVVAHNGGNRNSIGIESCIDNGSDYGTTLRYTAKLVAELLIEFDLNVNRVMQHNNFSGKYCPRSIRTSNFWSSFLDLVALEKYGKENFSDVEFVWTPTSNILSKDGKINTDIGSATEVTYAVLVTYGENTINKTYTTILNN
jgi:N-acetylmuramoyl-L-alanine amidase CwlA